jgi:hypothetical protein
MIIRKDIQQKTPEWFEIKWGKVGGSTSRGLFVPSDTLFIEIISQLTEDFEIEEEGFVSADMKRGNELEPVAFQKLCQFTGIDFETAGWLQCEEIPILGLSPDAISADCRFSGEAKCPARKKHISTVLADEIPSDNIAQCLHYFTINPKLEKHWFVSFRPECIRPLWIKELTLDSEINMGTEKTPKIKTVRDWVKIAKANAYELEASLQKAMVKLEQI